MDSTPNQIFLCVLVTLDTVTMVCAYACACACVCVCVCAKDSQSDVLSGLHTMKPYSRLKEWILSDIIIAEI